MNNADLQRHIGKFYGKYSGVVINNEDEEHRGQIMVRVPAIFGGEETEENTFLARPCLPYGHFYIPPVDAHVWVEFEGGHLAYPIWVGTWLPVDATVEQAAVSPPDNRVIFTPSGHIVEMNDKEGEEKITIRHKANAFMSIDHEGNILISNPNGAHIYLNAAGGESTLVDENGNILVMNSDGTLIVNNSGTALEMKGGGLRIIAGETVQISAKDIILDSSSVVLSNNAQFSALIGDIFATMFDTHMHPTAMGPSGPPVIPITGSAALSKNIKVK